MLNMLNIEKVRENKNIKDIEKGFNGVIKITYIDNLVLYVKYNDNIYYTFLENENLYWGYSYEPNRFYENEIYDEIYRMSDNNLRKINKKFY